MFLHLAQFGWFGPRQSNRGSSPASSSSSSWAQRVLCGQQCTGGWAHSGGAVPPTAPLLAEWATCEKHSVQGLCFSPPFPFPKPMLFNVGKRTLPALATRGLPAKEPKMHTYTWPRERAPGPTSGSSVERHWAKAKTKCSFKPCWAHKTLSHVITTGRGQFRVLSSAMVNPLSTVHF